ncbi:MAG: hypothetical protein K6L74_07595 [Neptuniibacter sp.]
MSAVLQHIKQLEDGLKALITLKEQPVEGSWIMEVELNYQSHSVGSTSFTLNGYSEEEAQALVKSLNKNHYIMKEIDHFLSGDWGE